MNTRLQVEHPVTEAITGIDLVREQIRIAAGLPLSFTQEEVQFEGHAIECRINAENPRTFAGSPGLITDFHAPGGLGVRLDSALYAGYAIPPYYDSLAGKLIVHGRDRTECIARLKRCLGEMVVGGIETTIPLFQDLLAEPDILAGRYHIHWLEEWLKGQPLRRGARLDRFAIDDLIDCYRRGVFPMADARHDRRVFLVDPARRGVLPLDGSTSPAGWRAPSARDRFEVRIDTAFDAVVDACAAPAARADGDLDQRADPGLCGELFARGVAHSVEAWRDGRLVGGLYGIATRRRLLRREHVLDRARRQQGGAGASGRAPESRRLPAARHPVPSPSTWPASGPRRSPRADYAGALAAALGSTADFRRIDPYAGGAAAMQAISQAS